VLAWDHRNQPAAIPYFFRIFDIQHRVRLCGVLRARVCCVRACVCAACLALCGHHASANKHQQAPSARAAPPQRNRGASRWPTCTPFFARSTPCGWPWASTQSSR
jgi:hypothetical protein